MKKKLADLLRKLANKLSPEPEKIRFIVFRDNGWNLSVDKKDTDWIKKHTPVVVEKFDNVYRPNIWT